MNSAPRVSRREWLRSLVMASCGAAAAAPVGRLTGPAFSSPATTEHWSVEERLLPAVALTRGPRQHFFGYYDKRQFDTEDRCLLGLECDVIGRLQKPDDVAVVGMVDLRRGNEWVPLAETRAWNWQMGCHAEWLPGEGRRIVYNDRRGAELVAVVRDVDRQRERVLRAPVFCVAGDGQWAVSLNFARLWRVRPETGFCGVNDAWPDDPAPAADGLFRLDLGSGKVELIVSHADMAPFRARDAVEGLYYFTHPAVNADGTRLLFWYRRASAKGGWRSSAYVAEADGRDIRLLAADNSHTVWLGRDRILAWLSRGSEGPGFYLFTDRCENLGVVGRGALNANGHALYSPDGRRLLTDRPLNRNHERTLVVADPGRRRSYDIGRFAEMRDLSGPLRCDLHARWSRSGQSVCFDSTHAGSRQMYMVDLRSVAF